jgi:hypothetical protein
MSEDYDAGPLDEEKKALAQPMLDACPNMCLMSGRYKGQEVGFLCQATPDDETGTMMLIPRFIVVTDDMVDDCTDPDGAAPENPPSDT